MGLRGHLFALESGSIEESIGGGDFYDQVYEAERPELFFKATALRVVGPGKAIRIRRDSAWNVPEPELALVLSSAGVIVGYTIGNDVSSRSIEGENPLYLPQAKVYDGSCALGPVIAVSENQQRGAGHSNDDCAQRRDPSLAVKPRPGRCGVPLRNSRTICFAN